MAKAKKDGLTAEQRRMKAEQAARSKRQVQALEAEKKAAQRRADAGALKVYEQRCKERSIKREARAERTAELRQMDAKKAAIRRKYQ